MMDEKKTGIGDRRSEIRGQQMQIKSAKDLKIYRKAFDSTMEIFAMLNEKGKKADAFCRPSS